MSISAVKPSATTDNRKSAGTARLALAIALGAETVFFLIVLVAYVALRSQVPWPVEHAISRLAFPLFNTGILAVSVVTAWRSLANVRNGQGARLENWLIVTLLLGLLFIAGQIYEFNRAGLQVSDQTFGAIFFILIGFHALHVLAGVIFLAINSVRSHWGDFTAERHIAVELSTWFWYFVAAVWLVIFTALYLV